MKIPKTVNIIGKSYTVLSEEPRDGEYGECDFRHTTLKVSPKQSGDGQQDTLLHEVMHAIAEEMQFPMSERTVRGAATGLLMVLRANPALVAYLLGK